MKISIIGAGIGGLTTAIALKQKGFEVEIFESSKKFKKAGSGINLAINAMQVYRRLGIYEKIASSGSYTDSLIVSDKKLNVISKVNLLSTEREYGAKTFAIHRATLHTILLKELEGVTIHFNKKFHSLSQVDDEVNFSFDDGTSYNSNILIGADGIHSIVRKFIFNGAQLRIAKQVCWRGIAKVETPEKYKTELNESWGKGKRFGFVHINKEEVYWFALTNYKTDYKKEFSSVDLIELFSDFNPLINTIISATKKENIILNEMIDLKPISNWYKNNVCLVGDAAHATTPNMGQGACQAIESAYVIAECLSTEKSNFLAFSKYEKIRKKNAVNIVNTSWSAGKMAHLENSVGIFLRNNLMRIIPKKFIEKQSSSIYKLNY